jgi:hypothetical protein
MGDRGWRIAAKCPGSLWAAGALALGNVRSRILEINHAKAQRTQRGLWPQPNQQEPRIEHRRNTDYEQEQTEKTEPNSETLFPVVDRSNLNSSRLCAFA